MTRVGENPPRLPKRFYAEARGEAGAILLDGRPAKTRAGNRLAPPGPLLLDAIVAEWNAQGAQIDFAAMPMTRFAMTVIDLGESDAAAWRAVVLSHLKSDLLCYRAAGPATLVERQNAAWDPLLDWARRRRGVALATAAGISFIEQAPEAIAAGERALARLSPAPLLGVKVAAEIAGSAVIALALADRAFAPETLFEASRVDEAHQRAHWGADAQAAAREAALRRDFLDAARFLSLA